MATENNNPFVLPGFGQSGDAGQNPLIASMEMMRQAWQGIAGPGPFDQSSMATPMSPEDLARRITDLRAVENWLRMNLTMLGSTIQALEVQRATIATLKSFMAAGTAGMPGGASPLEAALGGKPLGQAWQAANPWDASGNTPKTSANDTGGASKPAADSKPTDSNPAASNPAGASAQHDLGAAAANAAAASQGWWDMLQKQFDTLAAATAATLQGADALKKDVAKPSQDSTASSSTLGKKASASATGKAPARPSARPAPVNTSARKTASAKKTKAATTKTAQPATRKTAKPRGRPSTKE